MLDALFNRESLRNPPPQDSSLKRVISFTDPY